MNSTGFPGDWDVSSGKARSGFSEDDGANKDCAGNYSEKDPLENAFKPCVTDSVRAGTGWDLHRLVPDRPLILGGVRIPSSVGLLGHSDADVLIHSIIDALLGALNLGDIGEHFPPSDEKYKDISSVVLLQEVKKLVDDSGYQIVNIDNTLILEKIRLSDYKKSIAENLAKILDLDVSRVSVKAKTSEGIIGEILPDVAISQSVALLQRMCI